MGKYIIALVATTTLLTLASPAEARRFWRQRSTCPNGQCNVAAPSVVSQASQADQGTTQNAAADTAGVAATASAEAPATATASCPGGQCNQTYTYVSTGRSRRIRFRR